MSLFPCHFVVKESLNKYFNEEFKTILSFGDIKIERDYRFKQKNCFYVPFRIKNIKIIYYKR